MLTQQMTTILTPLIKTTNTRYKQLARQVGWTAEVVNVKEDQNDQISNLPLPPLHEDGDHNPLNQGITWSIEDKMQIV